MSEPMLLPIEVEPVELPARHAEAPSPEAVPLPVGKLRTADVHALLRKRYNAVAPGNGPRYVMAPEVRNQAGFGGYFGDGRLRTCDLMVMDTWQSGPVRLIGHEIKVSRSDWLRELKDPSKAAPFVAAVAEWWLVVGDRAIVKDGELPSGWGLMAPTGGQFRAVVQPTRKPQPEIPTGMLAALLRSVYGIGRAELEAAKRPTPYTRDRMPMSTTYDDVPRESPYGPLTRFSEIQRTPRRTSR